MVDYFQLVWKIRDETVVSLLEVNNRSKAVLSAFRFHEESLEAVYQQKLFHQYVSPVRTNQIFNEAFALVTT